MFCYYEEQNREKLNANIFALLSFFNRWFWFDVKMLKRIGIYDRMQYGCYIGFYGVTFYRYCKCLQRLGKNVNSSKWLTEEMIFTPLETETCTKNCDAILSFLFVCCTTSTDIKSGMVYQSCVVHLRLVSGLTFLYFCASSWEQHQWPRSCSYILNVLLAQ